MTPTTFETTFTRPDVRQHLRNKCASNYYKKMTETEKNTLYQCVPKTVNADGEQISPKPQDEFKTTDWTREIIGSWNRIESNYIPISEMEVIVMKPEHIDILNQKFAEKEAKIQEKKAAKEAEKEEKKAAKEAEKEEKKRIKLVIKDTVKHLTDSDKRVLITDNTEWLSTNGIVATSIEEYITNITANDYKKLFSENQNELNKMSWYQNNQ